MITNEEFDVTVVYSIKYK